MVEVDAFTLPLMTDACFAVTVYGTADPQALVTANVVWSGSGLCTSAHGAAPDLALALVAGCDPAAPGEGHVNTVRLELLDLYLGGAAGADGAVLSPDYYANPCRPGTDDCLLSAPCDAQGSGEASFALAVSAHPDLGVFDTRVLLGEVFCSAKLDCVDHGGQPLRYLPDAEAGEDGVSAVLGLACRAGDDGPASTWLYLDDLVVACEVDGVPTRWARVDPSGGPGRVAPDGPDPALLFGAAVHRGVGADAVYWNAVIGLRLDGEPGETCALTTRAAAAAEDFAAGETPPGARYPVIHWEAELWTVDPQGATLTCGRHALGGADGVVATAYTPLDAPACLAHELAVGPGGDLTTTSFTCP